MNRLSQPSSTIESGHSSDSLLRLGAGVLTALIVATGAACLTHKDTVASRTVVIPNAIPWQGIYPGDVTHEAICAATSGLVDTANLPSGVTRREREGLKGSCDAVATDVAETNGGDITNQAVDVTIKRDALGRYSLSAAVLAQHKS